MYTAKLFFAAFDLMKQETLDKKKPLLIIHCGGLQGNKGYEERYNLNPKRHVNDAKDKHVFVSNLPVLAYFDESLKSQRQIQWCSSFFFRCF